jgi:hypothetical protein
MGYKQIISKTLGNLIRPGLAAFGYRLAETRFDRPPGELSMDELSVINQVHKQILTHSSKQRLYATALAVDYVNRAGLKGAFVECGIWKGGNAIVAKKVADSRGDLREFFLYDTFSGHLPPGSKDVSLEDGSSASEKYESIVKASGSWAAVSVQEVKKYFGNLNVSTENVRFIEGDMMSTLRDPKLVPASISVLRLDTDWYEPTKLQLEELWPKLEIGGVLLLDDYGHWAGSKAAVDEYFAANGINVLLTFSDWSGRAAIKMA